MKFFTITLIILLWLVILNYKKKKAERTEQSRSESFWSQESKANTTRKKDLSQLTYVTIPFETLPFEEHPDAKLEEIQNAIKKLDGEKIVNLTGISNTELKLTYGAPNLDTLSEYDYNFTLLARNINQWGQYLYDHGQIEKSQTVLEYGIKIHSDVSGTYNLLAKIYKETNQNTKIDELIRTAETLNTLMKNSILKSLNSYRNQ